MLKMGKFYSATRFSPSPSNRKSAMHFGYYTLMTNGLYIKNIKSSQQARATIVVNDVIHIMKTPVSICLMLCYSIEVLLKY